MRGGIDDLEAGAGMGLSRHMSKRVENPVRGTTPGMDDTFGSANDDMDFLDYIPCVSKRPVDLHDRLRVAEREVKIAVCVTVYTEGPEELQRTLDGISENLAALSREGDAGVHWKEICVFVIIDGRSHANPELLAFAQKSLQIFDPLLLCKDYGGSPVTMHLFERTIHLQRHESSREYHFPLQLAFCLKEKNAGKLNSHLWFFSGFCRQLHPTYTFQVDVGTVPREDSIARIFRSMEKNTQIAGCCGEIVVNDVLLYNMLVASQHFEYKISHAMEKAMESWFGFVTVLPGAFCCYRWKAIQGEPLAAYFTVEEHSLKALGPLVANMYLAEDRVMCFESVTKRGGDWTLHYRFGAVAETDVPQNLVELIKQRRRWLNGSFFALAYYLTKLHTALGKTRHSCFRRTAFFVQFIYQLVSMVVTVLTIGSFYLSQHIIIRLSFGHLQYGPLGLYCFALMYGSLVLVQVLTSLGNKPEDARGVHSVSSLIFGITLWVVLFLSIVLLFNSEFSVLVTIGAAASVAAYFWCAMLHGDLVSVAFALPQYLFTLPTYIIILSTYSFCNIHDISWGTKQGKVDMMVDDDLNQQSGDTMPKAEPKGLPTVALAGQKVFLKMLKNIRQREAETRKAKLRELAHERKIAEKLFKAFRTRILSGWLLINFMYISAVIQFNLDGPYAWFLAIILITVLTYRVVGSTMYHLERGTKACLRRCGCGRPCSSQQRSIERKKSHNPWAPSAAFSPSRVTKWYQHADPAAGRSKVLRRSSTSGQVFEAGASGSLSESTMKFRFQNRGVRMSATPHPRRGYRSASMGEELHASPAGESKQEDLAPISERDSIRKALTDPIAGRIDGFAEEVEEYDDGARSAGMTTDLDSFSSQSSMGTQSADGSSRRSSVDSIAQSEASYKQLRPGTLVIDQPGAMDVAFAAQAELLDTNMMQDATNSRERPYFGVVRAADGRYHAQIREVSGTDIDLGSYDDAETAARVYDTAALMHFGHRAKLNFPGESTMASERPDSGSDDSATPRLAQLLVQKSSREVLDKTIAPAVDLGFSESDSEEGGTPPAGSLRRTGSSELGTMPETHGLSDSEATALEGSHFPVTHEPSATGASESHATTLASSAESAAEVREGDFAETAEGLQSTAKTEEDSDIDLEEVMKQGENAARAILKRPQGKTGHATPPFAKSKAVTSVRAAMRMKALAAVGRSARTLRPTVDDEREILRLAHLAIHSTAPQQPRTGSTKSLATLPSSASLLVHTYAGSYSPQRTIASPRRRWSRAQDTSAAGAATGEDAEAGEETRTLSLSDRDAKLLFSLFWLYSSADSPIDPRIMNRVQYIRMCSDAKIVGASRKPTSSPKKGGRESVSLETVQTVFTMAVKASQPRLGDSADVIDFEAFRTAMLELAIVEAGQDGNDGEDLTETHRVAFAKFYQKHLVPLGGREGQRMRKLYLAQLEGAVETESTFGFSSSLDVGVRKVLIDNHEPLKNLLRKYSTAAAADGGTVRAEMSNVARLLADFELVPHLVSDSDATRMMTPLLQRARELDVPGLGALLAEIAAKMDVRSARDLLAAAGDEPIARYEPGAGFSPVQKLQILLVVMNTAGMGDHDESKPQANLYVAHRSGSKCALQW